MEKWNVIYDDQDTYFTSIKSKVTMLNVKCIVQVALVIRGFVIRSFGYPKPVNYVQSSLSADISLVYPAEVAFF